MPASIFGTPTGLTSFRLYLAVNFISLNGLWINRIVLGWLAWSLSPRVRNATGEDPEDGAAVSPG